MEACIVIEDEVCFDPLNPELDIVEVKEERNFDKEPAIQNEMSSVDEVEACNTDRQDASLTMRRFDGKEPENEEEIIIVRSEFGSSAGSGNSAMVHNTDEDGVCFDPLNLELDIVEVKEERNFDKEPAIQNEMSSVDEVEACNTDRQDASLTMRRFDGKEPENEEEIIIVRSEFGSSAGSGNSAMVHNTDEDGVCFDPLNPELDIVEVKEERNFEEEPAIQNEMSSVDDEESCNTDRQDAGSTVRRFDGEEFVKEEEIGSSAESEDSTLVDNNSGEKLYQCKICSYKATQRGHLSRHMITHTGDKPHPCRLCTYKAATKGNLSRHMRTHRGIQIQNCLVFCLAGERRNPCKLCTYKATQHGHLSRHMRTHKGERLYPCKLCTYKATHSRNLSRHMRIHKGEKPYACDQCSFRTAHLNSINHHRLIHTGEKPLACKCCDYRTSHHAALRRHVRSQHTGKTFPCKLCKYEADDLGHLSTHMRTHTGERPYPCKLCTYKATQRGHLSRHMRTHTGEKPSKCRLCVYSCMSKSGMRRHMTRMHPKEPPLPFRMSLPSKTSDSIGSNESNDSSNDEISTGQRPAGAESISSGSELDYEP